jgi:hypothetical protein
MNPNTGFPIAYHGGVRERIGNFHATVGCAPPDAMRPTRTRFPV